MDLGVSSLDDGDEALEGDMEGNMSCAAEGRRTSRSDSVVSSQILVELIDGGTSEL